jgi:hypothetical protein
MKIRLLGALVGLAINFAVPTFAQEKETVDPQLIQKIRALSIKYDEAFNKNDAAALAALYTEDAVGDDTGPIYSREAIPKYCRRVQASSCQQPYRPARSVFPSHSRYGQRDMGERRMESDFSRQERRSYTSQGLLVRD